MGENRRKVKILVKFIALAVGYYVAMIVAYSLWMTGAGSFVHVTEYPLMIVGFLPLALVLSAIVNFVVKPVVSR